MHYHISVVSLASSVLKFSGRQDSCRERIQCLIFYVSVSLNALIVS